MDLNEVGEIIKVISSPKNNYYYGMKINSTEINKNGLILHLEKNNNDIYQVTIKFESEVKIKNGKIKNYLENMSYSFMSDI